ncbi:microfibrillar-associated protein 1 [Planococcus citri]|uniref:microfibrillar-associated protein 1 n=1 Tax=Planococcus citri TaxID=170843 RepID=UPI0031F930F2
MEPIQSTAGAVPVLNEKGEVSMQKVKVHRYVSGKRPEYAPVSSSEEESEEEDFIEVHKQRQQTPPPEEIILPTERILATEDPRLRRLINRKAQEEEEEEEEDEDEADVEERAPRWRHANEAEAAESESEEERDRDRMDVSGDDDEDDEDLSDEEIERRRLMLRQRVLNQKHEQNEVLEKEDERFLSGEESGVETSEYEEYSDSEEESEARLKPVFTRQKDRLTIIEREKEAARKRQMEVESKKKVEERRRQTLKLVEEEIRKEQASAKTEEGCIEDVNTDDENDEVEYEAWKLREMKRNKRDRDEREQMERENMEIERLRNLTEEERRQELRLNPKQVVNKSVKGKYKFMQKYYHRGAFYLDKDDTIFKRNFATATLDDHFDKTILPKVMQVKNFGRSGRTKYTHLVDQDTTQFDSPWISETSQNLKFHNNQAAGVKQVFARPSLRKHKQK